MLIIKAVNITFGFLFILRLVQSHLPQAIALNYLAKNTASLVISSSSADWKRDNRLNAIEDCRSNWYRGFAAQWEGNQSDAEKAWRASIRCETIYIPMLATLLPNNRGLAAFSVQTHSEIAYGWLWLAKITGEDNPIQAIELYRKGLELAPDDGLAWRQLGDLLVSEDPNAAIEAYLQSCFNGDPGSHGCYRAGQTAEQIGELENAIRYYRFSHWEGALQRARELQAANPDATQL